MNVCDRFLERTKLSRSGARPGRELFIARLGLGTHGGANGLVPLLPASLCELDKAIRIALGERHVEKCQGSGMKIRLGTGPNRHLFYIEYR